MTALILDTSQKTAILGLIEGKTLVKEFFLHERSQAIFSILPHFCDLKNLLYIAVGTGPGSYIGTRTAATIAKTLSFALNIPLIDFPSPLAFLPSQNGTFTIVGDAKMKELYVITGAMDNEGITSFSSPLIQPKKYKSCTDIVLDMRQDPTPNLKGICHYLQSQFKQGNILDTNSLTLSYLRD